MYKWLLLLSILLMVGFADTVSAQQYKYRHITPDDGLPSTTVYRIIQDSKGFIWIATDAGICRYDGNKFQTFTVKDGLPDNEILNVYEDKLGRIWFCTFKKEPSYFYHDSIVKFNPGHFFDDTQLLSFAQDKKGNLWFSTSSKGLLKYKDGKWEIFNSKNCLTNDYVILNETTAGDIWMTTYALPSSPVLPVSKNIRNTTGRLISQKFLCTLLNDQPGEFRSLGNIIDNDRFIVLDKDTEGGLYYFGRRKLSKETAEGDTMNLLSTDMEGQNQVIMKVNYDHDNNFLVGTSAGAYRVTRSNKPIISSFKPKLSINDVMEDREYNLWFATLHDGVYFLSRAAQKVNNYVVQTDNNQPQLSSIVADSGVHQMLFGSINGNVYTFLNKEISPLAIPEVEKYVSLGHAVRDSFGNIWCGTTFGLYILHKGNIKQINRSTSFYGDMIGGELIGKEVLLSKKFNAFRLGAVKSISLGKNNDIWISSFYGVYVIQQHDPDNYILKQFHNTRTSAVCCDDNGKVWFGTAKGLCYLDHDTMSITPPTKWGPLSNIMDIKAGAANTLWVATSDLGLFVFREGKLVQRIFTANGLSSDMINKIRIYDGYAFAVGKQGINKLEFNQQGIIIKVFPLDINDGLASREVNDVYKENGRVYAATNLGLSVFDESSVSNDTLSPLVYLSRIKINERDTSIVPNITLPYNRNNISIEYVGLFYKNKNLLYRYKMEGLNKGWIETRFTNIQYPALPPGKYTFIVDSRSLQGSWSGKPASVTFVVQYPFWQTWWFRVAILLAFVIIIAIVTYAVFNYYRNKNEVAKKLVLLEGQALRAQMNPHFIFNSLNAIHDFIADHDQRSAHIYLSRFAALIRRTLDLSRKPTVSLSEELETLKLYLELEILRFKGKIEYKILVNTTEEPSELMLPAMLLQPYIENAIRHGLMNKEGKGLLTLQVTQEENTLKCAVTDNGVGRKVAGQRSRNIKAHQSHAMDITGERMNIFNEKGQPVTAAVRIIDLEDDLGNARGTTVELTIPLNHR